MFDSINEGNIPLLKIHGNILFKMKDIKYIDNSDKNYIEEFNTYI